MCSKPYKGCAVFQCGSNTKKTPEKLFIHVPMDKDRRKMWLQLARKNQELLSKAYFCEDHFDLPNDMENYTEYLLMGCVSRIRMRADCLPTKFAWLNNRETQIENLMTQPLVKIEREIYQDYSFPNCGSIPTADVQEPCSSTDIFKVPVKINSTSNKSTQVSLRHKYRSKSTQTTTSTYATSPFKSEICIKSMPSECGVIKTSRMLFSYKDESSDADVTFSPSSSSSSQLMEVSSENSSNNEEILKQKRDKIVEMTIRKIRKRPRFFIGVPKKCYPVIKSINQCTNIPEKYILLCLKKIRLDTKFSELADEFGISVSFAKKVFFKYLPIICSVMRPFLVTLEKNAFKQSLPYRHKYDDVSCIIDCLEIEIKKPSNVVHQSLTWSEVKKANTLKYLISGTPDGLINYISQGYGGRTSDACVVESCDFLSVIEKGSSILADRGFKNIEDIVHQTGLKLVRPPSVSTGCKLSRQEVCQTKQIASLRIHIERVIRRLREFNMVKPHACININLTKILDEAIIIASGLINIQDSIIKQNVDKCVRKLTLK